MADSYKNFAYGTVLTAPAPTTSGTSLALNGGQGALMPAVPFNAVVWPAGTQPSAANAEVVRVTAVATDTLTIARTQEGSSARSVTVGDQFAAAVTARTLGDVDTDMTPDDSVVINAGRCKVTCRPYTINAGVAVTIRATGRLLILG